MKAKDILIDIENELWGVEMEKDKRECLEQNIAHLKLKIADLQEVKDAHQNLWRLLKELES